MLPTNAEWNFIRKEEQRFMPDTVSIYSVTQTYTNENGYTTVRTLLSTSKARISETNGNETQQIIAHANEPIENIETAKLHLPYGTTIDVNNEVKTADNKYWRVVHTNSSQTFTGETKALLYRKVVNNQEV